MTSQDSDLYSEKEEERGRDPDNRPLQRKRKKERNVARRKKSNAVTEMKLFQCVGCFEWFRAKDCVARMSPFLSFFGMSFLYSLLRYGTRSESPERSGVGG